MIIGGLRARERMFKDGGRGGAGAFRPLATAAATAGACSAAANVGAASIVGWNNL